MTTSKELILAPTIGTTPDTAEMLPAAEAIKTDLLARADAIVITRDSTTEVRDVAISLAGSIAGHLKQVEADREAAGKPFWNIFKKINEIAKAHSDPLATRLRALNTGIGAVNDRLERDRLAEQQRFAAEQLKLQEQKAALEAAKDELDLLPPKKPATLLKKEIALSNREETLGEEERRLEQERIDAAERARQSRHTGGAQRKVVTLTITDIKALYDARPELVKLTADEAAIKYLYGGNKDLKLPGVIITEQAMFSARAK